MAKYLKILLLVLMITTANACTAKAATEFLTSWKANTFVNAAYTGKILPTRGSQVTLAFELLDNDKIADISKNEVAWFRGGSKFDSGLGKRKTTLTLPTLNNNESVIVKIIVRQNKGANIEKFVIIPIASPEVVINSPYPLNIISAGLSSFAPMFYFWNTDKTSNLLVSWTNGNEETQELAGNSVLQLSIPAGVAKTQLRLAATAKNPEREFENANDSINLIVK